MQAQCTYNLDSILPPNCPNDSTGAIFISDSAATIPCSSTVVAINEIMYRPNLNDGFSLNPLITGEYIELIGPAGTNIGCYVLTDGDWSITIPAGTTIPADGIFTLGHNSSPYATTNGITYDLDVANCGCFIAATGGDGILIFSNGGEYLSLHDNSGTFIDGVMYGSPSAGNTPPNGATASGGSINTVGLTGCVGSVNIPGTASFLTAPGSVAQNTSLIRSPDGSGAWTTQVGGSVNACNALLPSTFTYQWSNGATTQDVTGLTAGTYTVTITDGLSCTLIDSFTVTAPTAVVVVTDTTGASSCSGVNIAVSGGTGPYTYLWSNGATTEDLTQVATGNYCVTVTDNNNCVATFCDSTANPVLTIPIDTFYICQGDSVQLSAVTNLANIHWTPNGTLSDSAIANPFASPLTTTTYVVTASDTTVGTNNLVVNGDFEAGNVGFSSAYTVGTGGTWGQLSNEGTYAVNTNANNTHTNFAPCTDHTSGTGNFMVVNGATTANQDVWCQTVAVLPNTNYQFSTWITSVEGSNPAALQFSINGTPIGNIFNASAVTCQWNQFSATWNSGSNTTATICILNQNIGTGGNDFGLDDISFIGPAYCTVSDSITVVVNTVDVTLSNAVDVICIGDSSGSLDVTVTGGVAPYTYLWSNGATTQDIQLLPAGGYCVTVTDANGCEGTFCDTISNINLSIPVDTFYICQGDSVQLQAISNAPNITWTPSGSLNNDTILNPIATPTTTTQYVVTAGNPIANLVLNGDFEAGNVGFSSAYTVGTGGTWGQLSNEGTYAINTNANNTHTNFAPCTDHTSGTGNFMVVNGATTANQDVWCQTINVAPNTDYQFSTWITSVEGSNPAALQFSINGTPIGNVFNASPVTCQWNQFSATWNSGSNTTATICILNQNIGNGGNDFGLDDISFVGPTCGQSDTVVVIVDSLDVTLSNVTQVLCHGDSTGSIATSATDTTYTYLWNTGDSTTTLTNLSAGVYTLTVTSGLACQDSFSVTITEPNAALAVNSTTIDVTCNGGADGSIAVATTGGTPNYTYTWSANINNQTTGTVTGLVAGTYSCTITDANGCEQQVVPTIIEPSAIVASYVSTDITCSGTDDGTIQIQPTGGTPGYSYQWGALANNQTTASITGLASATYTVTITDTVGCESTASISILPSVPVDSNDVPLATLMGMVNCNLDSIGALGINTANTYTYLWSNGATTQNVTGLGVGNYTVTVSNALGCSYVQSGVITAPFVPNVQPFINTIGTTVATVTTGTTVTLNGGNDQTAQGVNYLWTASSPDVSLTNDSNHIATAGATLSGTYVLTITATASDSTACTDMDTVVLNVEAVFNGMPDAFTPNGDGSNDLYRPVGLGANEIIRFRIFNRWGQEIYNGDNLENGGWDGRYLNVDQPTEGYIYLLEYNVGGGAETKVLRSGFTLIR